jgi:two-component system OmpR family response regulator
MATLEAIRPVKKRILLVDDDENIAAVLHLLLSEHYAVDVVGNGAEAVENLRQQTYDAIVLDLVMPIMDGAEVKQHLDAERLDVPVLLMSANSELPARAAELGVDDFIAKPLDLVVLEHRLAALLARRAA